MLFANGRAIGVRLVDGNVVTGREIVLCAGTYGSPAILLRSGIGPAAHLRELGIPVTQHLPGVGENLLDHPLVSPDRPRPRLVRPEHAPRSRSFIPVLAKARSRHAGDDIDLHIYIGQNFDESHGAWFLWITASLQFARSQGRVRLTSADPWRHSTLTTRISATRPIWRLSATASSSPSGSSPRPRCGASSSHTPKRHLPWGDAQPACRPGLGLASARRFIHRAPAAWDRTDPWRSSTTTRRVHGVAGLRIVDASIFPTGPRANLHFTVVAVAEKLADEIRRDPSLNLELTSVCEGSPSASWNSFRECAQVRRRNSMPTGCAQARGNAGHRPTLLALTCACRWIKRRPKKRGDRRGAYKKKEEEKVGL